MGAEPGQHVRAEQLLDRVEAEEGGEQDRHGRQVGDLVGGRRGDAVGLEAGAIVCGRVELRPTIISVKKTPIDITCAEFWKVWFIPPPAPRSARGRLFITAARLGDANMPIEIPVSSRISANGT